MRIVSFFVLVAALLVATPALAHKVNLFAYVEGEQVVVEGYFTDGKRAQNSKVQVFGPGDELLVEGMTNDDGMYTFGIPQISDLRVSLYAGMGHRAEYTVPASELGGIEANGAVAAPEGPKAANAAQESGDAQAPARDTGDSQAIDPADIDPVVRKAVGEALQPVMRSLSELKESRTFSDIVGGIGFIVGIIGVLVYLKARSLSGGSSASGA